MPYRETSQVDFTFPFTPLIVQQVFQIIAGIRAQGYNRAIGGTECSYGTLDRRSWLCA